MKICIVRKSYIVRAPFCCNGNHFLRINKNKNTTAVILHSNIYGEPRNYCASPIWCEQLLLECLENSFDDKKNNNKKNPNIQVIWKIFPQSLHKPCNLEIFFMERVSAASCRLKIQPV